MEDKGQPAAAKVNDNGEVLPTSGDKHDDDAVRALVEIVQGREAAFRHYFSEQRVPRLPADLCHRPSRDKDTWDQVLNPKVGGEGSSSASSWHSEHSSSNFKFTKLGLLVNGLYRTSSELLDEEKIKEFFGDYPAPYDADSKPSARESELLDEEKIKEFFGDYPAPYDADSKPSARESTTEFHWHPWYLYPSWPTQLKLQNGYCSEKDVTRIMCELECARMVVKNNEMTSSTSAAADSKPNSDMKIEQNTFSSFARWGEIPSLTTLCQKQVNKNMLQESLHLEATFCSRLTNLRTDAQDAISSLVESGQSELEKSEEASAVRELRQKLQEVEKALFSKQETLHHDYQNKVDVIVKQYDQDRAMTAVNYVHERNDMIERQNQQQESIPDDRKACAGCASPFLPQGRQDLHVWDRCYMADCTSGMFYCMDCSSDTCSICMAPVCVSHKEFHQMTCKTNMPTMCGYDGNSLRKGLNKGCCGSKNACGVHCKQCDVLVCKYCEYRDEPEHPPDGNWDWFFAIPNGNWECFDEIKYPPNGNWDCFDSAKQSYCPGCAPKQAKKTPGPRQAFHRKRVSGHASSPYNDVLAPVERIFKSSNEWRQEQTTTHQEWWKHQEWWERQLQNNDNDDGKSGCPCGECVLKTRLSKVGAVRTGFNGPPPLPRFLEIKRNIEFGT